MKADPNWSMRSPRARMSMWALAAVCGQAAALCCSPASAQVRWKTGLDGAAERMDAVELREAVTRLSTRETLRRVVVQFDEPVSTEQRDKLAQAGVRLLSYLGDHAYFASLADGADGALAATVESLAVVQGVKAEWKIDPMLLRDEAPSWAVVDPGLLEDEAAKHLPAEEAAKADPVVGVYVMLHQDVTLDLAAWNMAARHGGVVRDQARTVNALVVEMPMSKVAALAAEDDVQWIEPALPKFSELNAQNRVRVGADIAQDPPYSLSGAGVTALIYDGGRCRNTHMDFGGRLTNGDTDSVSDHSTHVAGTVGGSGAASGGTNRGMAPGCNLVSFGFEYDGTGTFLYTNPGDFEADYGAAINTYGAVIANNSIGTNTAPNGFPCEFEGNYGLMSSLIDGAVRGSLGQKMRIVWANGNERQGTARCGSTYLTTAPPACAKNHITVGALNSNDDSVTSFTSWGPSEDGRIKPDISAPGCQSGGDNGVTSCGSASDTSYTSKCGTSMASPTVCGMGVLLIEDYRVQFPGKGDMLPSTLKVFLAHTAQDIQNPGPDYMTGYGSVRLVPAIEFMRSGAFIEGEVAQGQVHQALAVVGPSDTQLKITMAWDDFPGTPNVYPNLVNDLDLRVIDPMGVRHYPWTLNPASPATNAVRTQEDHVNNIEQVLVDAPIAGVWTVEIVGTAVPQGPQTFSVGVSPLLVDCSPAGAARLDAQVYPCEDVAGLRVVDCDLNTDDKVVEMVMATVTSNTEPSGEAVLLVETGPQTAAFEAMLPISATDASGTLHVTNGDTITLTYIDADDGMGGVNVVVTATAGVDCAPPVVSDVQVTNLEARSATVTFMTDEPARSTVLYGLSCGAPTNMAQQNSLQTSHTINLVNLQDNTTYSFSLTTEDPAGNMSTADNGGVCFSFTTPEIPDYFTELFNTGNPNDIDNRMIMLSPNGSVDFYAACSEVIDTLPTDPAGGTELPLTDDNSIQVMLQDGATVSLYGTAYSSFYVGSNGYITFTASDTDLTESLADHFDTPRISMLFDNLNPTLVNGEVTWKQMTDRAVVTYLNVTSDSTTNPLANTFQVEMFFDGRISMSWLDVGITGGLVGVSNGGGIPPLFTANDLSAAFGACGPRPPGAASLSVGTPSNTALPIALVGSDDGLPDPPAGLTYIIETLPADGRLSDPNGGLINSAPYTLAAGGSDVTYIPDLNFTANDGFTYKVNDGGVAPEGGDSNIANVAIEVGIPAVVYTFPFDTDPGWSTMGQWQFGQPLGLGTHNQDPMSGFTGDFVYGYNLAGDYAHDLMTTLWLTTTAIDCSAMTRTTLAFQRWLGIESATFDKAFIDVSTDNANWTNVWTHAGPAINQASWQRFEYDISAIADNQPTVYIRWGIGPTDGSVSYPGWNIDDVEILGVLPLTANPADLDGDGIVGAGDLALMLGNWGPCESMPCIGDLDGDGAVGATDLALLLGSWGAAG